MTPEQGNVQPWRENVERVQEALDAAFTEADPRHGGAFAALDALTTQIEELEHDAIDVEADRRYQQDRARAAEQRVEELERERDEARKLLAAEGPCEQRLDEEISAHIKTEARAEKAERALADLTEVVDLARIDLLGDTSRVQVKRRLDDGRRVFEEASDEN